jgi:hypothetical protein
MNQNSNIPLLQLDFRRFERLLKMNLKIEPGSWTELRFDEFCSIVCHVRISSSSKRQVIEFYGLKLRQAPLVFCIPNFRRLDEKEFLIFREVKEKNFRFKVHSFQNLVKSESPVLKTFKVGRFFVIIYVQLYYSDFEFLANCLHTSQLLPRI